MDRKRTLNRFRAVDSDVDGLRDHYRRTLKPVHIDPGPGNRTISVEDLHFSLGECDVWGGACQSGMEVSFCEIPDVYALYVPLSGTMELDVGGLTTASMPGTMTMCNLADVESLRLAPDRSHIGIAFSKRLLTRELSNMIDAPVGANIRFPLTIDATDGAAHRLTEMCRFLWRHLSEAPESSINETSSDMLVHAVMTSLLETIPHTYSSLMSSPRPAPAPRHVKRAIEYMTAELARPLSIDEIAAAVGVSARTLQLGFQDFKGMPPLAYLRTLRLDGVRRDLTAQRSHEHSIAEIARRWGFLHMGRFAALYFEAYGETPRQTLVGNAKPR